MSKKKSIFISAAMVFVAILLTASFQNCGSSTGGSNSNNNQQSLPTPAPTPSQGILSLNQITGGPFTQISITTSPDGRFGVSTVVAALNSSGEVSTYDSFGGGSWVSLSGATLSEIAAISSIAIYGVDSSKNLWKSVPLGTTRVWEKVSGVSLDYVSAGSLTSEWGLNGSSIYEYSTSNGQWNSITGGPSLVQISGGHDGTVMGVDANQNVWQYSNGSWVQISGSMVQVSVGSASYVVGINSSGELFQYANSTWTQLASPTVTTFSSASVTGSGALWVLDNLGNAYNSLSLEN